jgi:hypothetical protein
VEDKKLTWDELDEEEKVEIKLCKINDPECEACQ